MFFEPEQPLKSLVPVLLGVTDTGEAEAVEVSFEIEHLHEQKQLGISFESSELLFHSFSLLIGVEAPEFFQLKIMVYVYKMAV